MRQHVVETRRIYIPISIKRRPQYVLSASTISEPNSQMSLLDPILHILVHVVSTSTNLLSRHVYKIGFTSLTRTRRDLTATALKNSLR